MEAAESNSSAYALGPPWLFKGRALYQLHLVKVETARAFIPQDLKLVEAFGYTLGGVFLAHYNDSPVGMFDELVVIAGLIWNPPTSCAWAARVLVSNHEACRHGRKEVGLPSNVGVFSKRAMEITEKPLRKCNHFLNMIGMGSANHKQKERTEVQISEIKGSSRISLCNISLPFVVPESHTDNKWMGPMIRMLLPNFSGQTIHNPHLLKYSCQMECRVRVVEAAKISGPSKMNSGRNVNEDGRNLDASVSADDDAAWNQSVSVLLSKPILALEFNLLKMQVETPTVVIPHS